MASTYLSLRFEYSTLLLLCLPSCFYPPYLPAPPPKTLENESTNHRSTGFDVSKNHPPAISASSSPGTTVMSSTTWPPSSAIQRSHAWDSLEKNVKAWVISPQLSQQRKEKVRNLDPKKERPKSRSRTFQKTSRNRKVPETFLPESYPGTEHGPPNLPPPQVTP